MVKQMERVQKEEHRTRSELLREAWRQYFESRYGTYTPAKLSSPPFAEVAPPLSAANS